MNWHEYFTYDKKRGVLIWKKRPVSHFKTRQAFVSWNIRCCGKDAGHFIKLRRCKMVSLNYRNYVARTIIWEMHHGPILAKKQRIVAKNGDTMDDRIQNLECMPHRVAIARLSRKTAPCSGMRGVYRNGSGFRSSITDLSGRKIHIGQFKSASDAYAAYRKYHVMVHGSRSAYFSEHHK